MLYSQLGDRVSAVHPASPLYTEWLRQLPDSYDPPVQRKPLGGTEPTPIGHFVQMGDLNATAYIVKDVADGAEAGSWRWARKRPELRFYISR